MKIQVNTRNYIIFFQRKNFPTNVGSVRIFDTDCNISGYKIPKKVKISLIYTYRGESAN